ncbi:MAG: hypothetical protein L0Y66_18845 [Myxococcaceae bacterium]|nr:hypothetical protein [Myxococcaceae bacterium]MCI0671390.1 hypothetical protein [Myxococcaceae bacterium]
MGWWKVYDTDDVVGDAPLEILGDAILAVLEAYSSELKRPPTRAEWEHLLVASLRGMQESGMPVLADGVLTEVRVLAEKARPGSGAAS